MTDINHPAELYRAHLSDNILRWWLQNGPDHEYGGVFTCWDNTGTKLVSTDKYMWSQGRWTWLTARLAMMARRTDLGASSDTLERLALDTGRFIRDHGLQADGTTAYVLERDGSTVRQDSEDTHSGADAPADCFADMFASLGFAGLGQLTEDPQWSELAEDRLLSVVDRIEKGDFRTEPYPMPENHRMLSIPMITLGVAEQVHRATGSDASRRLVASSLGQIGSIFRQGEDVAEAVADGPRRADTLLARHRNPGHVLELAWFLHRASDLLPQQTALQAGELADIVLHFCRVGWDTEFGGLYRFVDRDGGRPVGHSEDSPYETEVLRNWDAKIWWPHVEALYATALLADSTSRTDLAEWHERVRDYTFSTFPAGEGGEWIQSRNRDGSPMRGRIGLPVKDPFHIARALMLLIELSETSEHS